mgnify:CR=1 FL=1
MNVYVYNRHHSREKEKTADPIDEIIIRAAVDISDNLAMPIRIEDDAGNVIMDQDDLNEKAWAYIESHNI